MASTIVAMFSSSFSSSKLTLPIGTWIRAVRSRRNSTRPRRASCPALAMAWGSTTVPARGGGAADGAPRLVGVARRLALGEDEHAHALAEAVGQKGRAADLLVGVARVEPGADVELDRLGAPRRCRPRGQGGRLT